MAGVYFTQEDPWSDWDSNFFWVSDFVAVRQSIMSAKRVMSSVFIPTNMWYIWWISYHLQYVCSGWHLYLIFFWCALISCLTWISFPFHLFPFFYAQIEHKTHHIVWIIFQYFNLVKNVFSVEITAHQVEPVCDTNFGLFSCHFTGDWVFQTFLSNITWHQQQKHRLRQNRRCSSFSELSYRTKHV